MHILLTDLLACPRCGPAFGLVVLADMLDDRRVQDGVLGCPNCRHSYPVTGGVADLRHPDSPPLGLLARPSLDDADRAFRAAALLGVSGPTPTVLIIEDSSGIAARVAALLADAHVVGCTADPPDSGSDESPAGGMLSRIVSASRLPFRDASLRAAAILGSPSSALVGAVLRSLSPGGRIVVESSPEGLGGILAEAGLEVLLEQEGVTVAAGPERR